MVSRKPRLLVKSQHLAKGLAFRVGKIPFNLEPLFTEPKKGRRGATDSPGFAAAASWHLTNTPEDVGEQDLWDLCYQLQTQGFGISGNPAVEAAEPDLEQRWIFDTPDRLAGKTFRATHAANVCSAPDPPDPRFPSPTPFDWRWFQDTDHSGLDDARSQVGRPSNRVAIAHLDTGYRQNHRLL